MCLVQKQNAAAEKNAAKLLQDKSSKSLGTAKRGTIKSLGWESSEAEGENDGENDEDDEEEEEEVVKPRPKGKRRKAFIGEYLLQLVFCSH